MTQVCVIFGAGEYYAGTPVVPAGAYVIAADGGLDHRWARCFRSPRCPR